MDFLGDQQYSNTALKLGEWLLDIQNPDGSWNGGLYPKANGRPSVFNTGQILKGMSALYRFTNDKHFLEAAVHGANWLSDGVSKEGLWPSSDYKAGVTPSYYTHVAWPMLEVWKLTEEQNILDAATRFLDSVMSRRKENGVFSDWGFTSGRAVTHTIAYTLRGLQESSRLLNDYERYGQQVESSLNTLVTKAELANGRLAAEFDENWRVTEKYTCLTGNAQLAMCILLLEQRQGDLRLVNAAAKLVDFIVSVQRIRTPFSGLNGAVAGSYPVWGKYMMLRYPNWAAKFFCDALIMLSSRLEAEEPG